MAILAKARARETRVAPYENAADYRSVTYYGIDRDRKDRSIHVTDRHFGQKGQKPHERDFTCAIKSDVILNVAAIRG